MRVDALDHVNISTSDVEASARFYADLLELDPRCNAAQQSPDEGRWLYDHNDHPIIHLRRFAAEGESTGAIHHVAFACAGMAEMIERLRTRNIAFSVNNGNYTGGLKQIFVKDPHGILLELNFAAD